MSSYLEKKWDWTVQTVKGSSAESDVKVFLWENDTTSDTSYTTDSDGKIATIARQASYTIDNTDDVTETLKTPHTISVCKYGLTPVALVVAFDAARSDTMYMEDNPYITETDESTVDGYTGISIDHSNELVTISEDHTMDELYDYMQHDMQSNPVKAHPKGALITNNGSDYTLVYDLTIDGCTLSGSGKFIDMHNNELTLSNDGSTSVKIQDVNGVLVAFSLYGLIDGSEVRVYKKSDMSELAGIEESGTSFAYNYNYTEDVDVIVVVFGIGYNPIRMELTLGSNDNSIPIQQQKDRWYRND